MLVLFGVVCVGFCGCLFFVNLYLLFGMFVNLMFEGFVDLGGCGFDICLLVLGFWDV